MDIRFLLHDTKFVRESVRVRCIAILGILGILHIYCFNSIFSAFFTVPPSQSMAFQGKRYSRQTRFCQLPSHYAVTSEQNER